MNHDMIIKRVEERRLRLQPHCKVDPVVQDISLQTYYRLARQLYNQAKVYKTQKEWDKAYMFLARFSRLCATVIPFHRDYTNPAHEKERKWINNHGLQALEMLDILLDEMEKEEKEFVEWEQELLEEDMNEDDFKYNSPTNIPQHSTTSPSQNPIQSDPPSLPTYLAQGDLNRTRPQATKMAYPSSFNTEKNKLMSQNSIEYPSVGSASWMKPGSGSFEKATSSYAIRRHSSDKALNALSSGQGRDVQIPAGIISMFTEIAAPNTNKLPYGIETCGILAGILDGATLIITTIIVPKQQGSADNCTMTNEEELFELCFSNGLLTLGWIHTHPKQTCFLSSVDIHTQCGFQSILPEAIAIVVAPTDAKRNVGVFRLTMPGGMELIQNCRQTGFHEHPSNIEIYSSAIKCHWKQELMANIVDMRQ